MWRHHDRIWNSVFLDQFGKQTYIRISIWEIQRQLSWQVPFLKSNIRMDSVSPSLNTLCLLCVWTVCMSQQTITILPNVHAT